MLEAAAAAADIALSKKSVGVVAVESFFSTFTLASSAELGLWNADSDFFLVDDDSFLFDGGVAEIKSTS